MLNKFKIVSISAIAVIMIAGCNHSSDPVKKDVVDQEQQSLPTVSSTLKSLAKSSRVSNASFDDLPAMSQPDQPSSMNETKDCLNGGTMEYTVDVNTTAIMQSPNDFNITMTSQAVNCIQHGTTANGKMQMLQNIKGEVTTMTTTFLTDFSFVDNQSNVTIKKDSFIVEVGDESTETMEVVVDGKSFKSIALKSLDVLKEDGTTVSYDISGKEIVDGQTFIVDETYDASKTPMITDVDDNLLKGGKAYYTNDQNHTIMMEAIETNKIQISVDEDGDGKVDKQEVISY